MRMAPNSSVSEARVLGHVFGNRSMLQKMEHTFFESGDRYIYDPIPAPLTMVW